MAKRGWVGAQLADGRWVLLTVWDDGWVELPGAGRSAAHARKQLGGAARAVAVLVGGLALVAGLVWLVNQLPSTLSWLMVVPVVALVALVVVVLNRALRASQQRWQRASADREQVLADRKAELAIERRAGAPLFRRARSAEEYADWVENETFVRAADVVSVIGSTDGSDHLAAVTLRTGQVLNYRSPDPALTRLLTPFDPTRSGGPST